ncbi:MAG TPA: 2,3,4,5-tetrahydropyridine-2,6-dicarboxylate N-succinyltransferase, partial [Bacteroidota bacterium]|nr:2,3,4,5-tetrahydropyridine-2,6-dicarboxylate N-succinyltransferase [Bacteroidota bacterium]
MSLKEQIESLFEQKTDTLDRGAALQAFNEFKFFLNQGDIRAAVKSGGDGNVEGWIVNSWVKK